MSITDKLKSRRTKPVEGQPARPLKTTDNLFKAAYGEQEYTRTATTVTVVTDAEADRLLGQPLTDAQRAGLAAQVELGR